MHHFLGRSSKVGKASDFAVNGGLALAGLSPGWGFFSVAVGVVTKFLMGRSVVTDEQLAKLVGATKEGAYLARIDATISNR